MALRQVEQIPIQMVASTEVLPIPNFAVIHAPQSNHNPKDTQKAWGLKIDGHVKMHLSAIGGQ